MSNQMKIIAITHEVAMEVDRAASLHAPMHNGHEGFAVLKEEVDELWDEVKKNPRKHMDRNALMRTEALQIAAMAVRFVLDVCDAPQCLSDSNACAGVVDSHMHLYKTR